MDELQGRRGHRRQQQRLQLQEELEIIRAQITQNVNNEILLILLIHACIADTYLKKKLFQFRKMNLRQPKVS